MKEIHLPHDHGNKTSAFIQNMPCQDVFDKTAETFALISDPTRVKILWLLCHTEDCVANIAAAIEMSSPAVSHHLRVLKQAGLHLSKVRQRSVLHFGRYRRSQIGTSHRRHHIRFKL